ncbi:MAG: type I-E CRISPR-associated protein Cas7/Cse4/CasC [Bacteroidales bacterium]|jgi:CRISPR system Cascade subunit CasC
MTDFIQIHALTAYPPSNLNRDDLGRPKTAQIGGGCRTRISSQSLKRAWRSSNLFQEALAGHTGIRTKTFGWKVVEALTSGRALGAVLAGEDGKPVRPKVDEQTAVTWATAIAGAFGKTKKGAPDLEQLVLFSPEEITAVDDLLGVLAKKRVAPDPEMLNLLRKDSVAADIAMFGRMLASSPGYNVDAAVQVAHAVTVHDVAVESDFFTAVDDLNAGDDLMGAAHMGETEFSAGLFYLYVCIDRGLLVRNLGGDEALAGTAVRALVEAITKVPPSGKQASFASRAYATYVLAEKGPQQPRSLASAFFRSVRQDDLLQNAVTTLRATRDGIEAVYGECCAECYEMDTLAGAGTLHDLLAFVAPEHHA